MTEVRLLGWLPKGSNNGITGKIASAFEKEPDTKQVVVALLEVKRVIDDADLEETVVVLRVRRIEAIVRPDDARAMKRIMMRANEERSGQEMLPFDNEDELEAFFEEWAQQKGDAKHDDDPFPEAGAPPPPQEIPVPPDPEDD